MGDDQDSSETIAAVFELAGDYIGKGTRDRQG